MPSRGLGSRGVCSAAHTLRLKPLTQPGPGPAVNDLAPGGPASPACICQGFLSLGKPGHIILSKHL